MHLFIKTFNSFFHQNYLSQIRHQKQNSIFINSIQPNHDIQSKFPKHSNENSWHIQMKKLQPHSCDITFKWKSYSHIQVTSHSNEKVTAKFILNFLFLFLIIIEFSSKKLVFHRNNWFSLSCEHSLFFFSCYQRMYCSTGQGYI